MQIALRIWLMSLLSLTTLGCLYAQFPAVAPDFTLTDTDGVSHQLSSYSAQGKTVVLNFVTTDCGECWNFHQTATMNDANDIYGAGGTDEMVFLTLEIDEITDLNSLQGLGLYTEGDWLTGNTHPILDGAEGVAADYNVTAAPVIIAVCPDGQIRDLAENGFPNLAEMHTAHYACIAPNIENDLVLVDFNQNLFCDTLEAEILVYNAGTNTINAAQIEFREAGIVLDTIDWAGEILPDESQVISLSTNIDQAIIAQANIVSINNLDDASTEGNTLQQSLQKVEQTYIERITITVATDGFGCETLWTFTDGAGTTLSSGGNVDASAGNRNIEYDASTGGCGDPGYDNNTTYSVSLPTNDTLNLAAGCYKFRIIDDWGDGMCCTYGDGYYTITDQDGNILAEGSDFGAEDVVLFDVTDEQVTSIDNVLNENELRIFPNPAQDVINLEFELEQSAKATVLLYNALGRVITTVPSQPYFTGVNTIQIDSQILPSGLYFVALQTGENTYTKRVTVTRP